MRAGVILGLAALSVGVTAQQVPPPFKSGVQVVEVDVRVFGRDGRFVADLTRGDFELIEEGVPQKIDAVHLVGGGEASSMPADDRPAVPPSLDSTPAPGPAAAQTWIFFFDLDHLTPGGGFERARRAVEAFLAGSFKSGDVGGILAGDKMINNKLTSIREELLQAVKAVKPRGDTRTRFLELTREWPRLLNEEEALRIARGERDWIQRAVTRACGDEPEQCNIADSAVRQKGVKLGGEILRASLATLSSLNALASGLARIPGPKAVVFLSDGFVAQEVETTVRSVVGQITRAGARVYAIDVRGTDRSGQSNLIDQAQVEDPAGPAIRSDSLADGPNSLAIDTGGMMIRNENDVGRALGRIADDAGRFYVLAYQPTNTNFDGKFRAIQVRVKREGVRVRARSGYLALPPSRMLVPQVVKAPGPVEPTPPKDEPPPERPPTTAAPTAPATPVSPSTASGTVVRAPAPDAPAGGVRLRPDVERRVKALSTRDGEAPAGDLVTKGWEAYQRGDLETAEAALSRAAAQPNARPWVLYALGMSQVALGQMNEAIASWERVRRTVPDFEPVYLDLADAYAAKSDLTTALATVREAEKRWPASPDVLSAVGVIHVSRGAMDEGIDALVRVTELTPEDALAHLNLGRAYALRFQRGRRYVTSQRRWVAPEGDREKAIDALRRCVQLGGFYAKYASQELSLLEWSK